MQTCEIANGKIAHETETVITDECVKQD